MENDDCARYFVYECGIRDCPLYHQQLIDEGLFEEAGLSETLNTFKVPELKELLKQLMQPVSGKKAVLIDRIIKSADEEFIKRSCPDKVYKLSESGWNFLNEHKAYIELHRHSLWGISWRTYEEYACQGRDFLSTAKMILNERLKSTDMWEVRHTYLSLYALHTEQGKRSDALEMLLKLMYLDLSGWNMLQMIEWYREGIYTKDRLKKRGPLEMGIAPGLYRALANFKDVYYPEMIDLLYTWELPLQLCDKELFREIMEGAIYEESTMEQDQAKLMMVYDRFVDEL